MDNRTETLVDPPVASSGPSQSVSPGLCISHRLASRHTRFPNVPSTSPYATARLKSLKLRAGAVPKDWTGSYSLPIIWFRRLLEEKVGRELLVLVACKVRLDDEVALEAEVAELDVLVTCVC